MVWAGGLVATHHRFRAFLTYELPVNGCNPVVIATIRGDRAAKMQDFYTMQVLGFEKIREEYLKAVTVLMTEKHEPSVRGSKAKGG